MFSTCLTIKKKIYTKGQFNNVKKKRDKKIYIFYNWPRCEENYCANGRYHRIDGPAIIRRHSFTGNVIEECWYNHGIKIRLNDKPSQIHYFENGLKKIECWYEGIWLHRTNNPSTIHYYDNGNILRQEWHVYGRYHNSDHPSIINYHKNGDRSGERWYYCGKLHRLRGPAVLRYYKNGRINRDYYDNGRLVHRNNNY